LHAGASEAQLNYIAGLFDGEGSAGVYRPLQLLASIHMGSRLGVDYVASCFGGHIDEIHATKPNCHNLYVLTYSHLRAEAFLRALLPHLIVKREEVELHLETWDRLKTTPRWAALSVIKEYRDRLVIISPHRTGHNGRRTRGPDKHPRKQRCARIPASSSFQL